MNKKRILVGSPVYQKPEILAVFLKSLKNLNRRTIAIDYMFVDDNIDDGSCDNTINMCGAILKGIPLHIIQNEKSMFASEIELRKKQWNETAQHCGRFPINTFSFPKAISEFRVKHLGWATQEDRATKYKRYQLLDPDAIYGIREQYDSIMDTNPNLIKWEVREVI